MITQRCRLLVLLLLPVLLQACTNLSRQPQTVEQRLGQQQASGCVYTDKAAAELLVLGAAVRDNATVRPSALLLQDGLLQAVDEPVTLVQRYPDANRLECTGVLIVPALINAHEHIAYSFAPPPGNLAPVYAHRDEWREGQNGKPKLIYAPTKDLPTIALAELRHLLHGETVVAGSGGVAGLVKNVAAPDHHDVTVYVADTQTFPLGTDVNRRAGGLACDADPAQLGAPTLTKGVPLDAPFVPHVGEGANCAAKLEIDDYLRYVEQTPGRRYSLIHAVMLQPAHLQALRDHAVSVIWSPRSNLALYGKTIDAAGLLDAGVNVGMGTDWSLSGSFDMLEEMRCARDANRATAARALTGAELLGMATIGAARALGIDDKLGSLSTGKVADIAIFADPEGAGTELFGRQDNNGLVALLVNGKLMVSDAEKLQGQLPQQCSNIIAGKHLCQDFSALPYRFDQIQAASKDKVNLIGTQGQASCSM